MHFDLLLRDSTELQSLYSHLILPRNNTKQVYDKKNEYVFLHLTFHRIYTVQFD